MFSGPIAVGLIKDNTHEQDGFFWISIFFVIFGSFGVLTGSIIFFINRGQAKDLNAVVMNKLDQGTLVPIEKVENANS
jgi:hypothetical protein